MFVNFFNFTSRAISYNKYRKKTIFEGKKLNEGTYRSMRIKRRKKWPKKFGEHENQPILKMLSLIIRTKIKTIIKDKKEDSGSIKFFPL